MAGWWGRLNWFLWLLAGALVGALLAWLALALWGPTRGVAGWGAGRREGAGAS